jgi:serine/threonine-protein kinase RsbW
VNVAVQTRTFGVSSDEVSAIDGWVEKVAAQWGQSERAVFGARLCIAELAANVLEHGGASSSDDHIIVTICRLDDGIEIEFLDSRAAFDPTAKSVATKSASAECEDAGGLGLMLLQARADELTYCNDGTYNRVKLKIKS